MTEQQTGQFIALEGGEGAGKSTQARMLMEKLKADGHEVILTREPGGTPGAEAIRAMLLDPPGEGWGARAEAHLFAAARADHVERLIRPALARGVWVICDRFVDSSRAYQGGAGGVGDTIVRCLHDAGSAGLLPDLTLIFSVSDAVRATRLTKRDGAQSDAIGGRDAAYHAAVNAAFLQFAQDEPGRFAVIDGNGSAEEVHQRVMESIGARL